MCIGGRGSWRKERGGGAGVDFASVADSEHYSVHKDAKTLHSGVKQMKANKI